MRKASKANTRVTVEIPIRKPRMFYQGKWGFAWQQTSFIW